MLGFVAPEDAIPVAEAVMTTQRDWGNRQLRKRARLKYTIEDRGIEAFKAEVEKRFGKPFGDTRPYTFSDPMTSSAGARATTRSGT